MSSHTAKSVNGMHAVRLYSFLPFSDTESQSRDDVPTDHEKGSRSVFLSLAVVDVHGIHIVVI